MVREWIPKEELSDWVLNYVYSLSNRKKGGGDSSKKEEHMQRHGDVNIWVIMEKIHSPG